MSASRLSSSEKLSFLSLPFGPTCYFGSHPSINLLLTEVNSVSTEIFRRIEPLLLGRFALSYKTPTRPEQDFCRTNLVEFLDVVINLVPTEIRSVLQTKCDADAQRFYVPFLTKEGSLPEMCILYKSGDTRTGVVAAEAKSVFNSAFEATPQAVALAAEFAMDQVCLGLAKWHEVLVVFVLTFGDSIQFGAVYLLEENFPCATMLSRPLSFLLPTDRDIISCWAVALGSYCGRCVQLFQSISNMADNRCVLTVNYFFLKPVVAIDLETASFALVQLLCAFQMLYDYEPCRKYIEFPIGQMGMPDEEQVQSRKAVIKNLDVKFRSGNELYLVPGFPIVIYRRLDKNWRNCADCLEELSSIADTFLTEIREVFSAVANAGLIHLDGRLANFMFLNSFTSEDDPKPELRLKLIDWDSCARVGYNLSETIKASFQGDHRYPSGESVATISIHEYFIRKIENQLFDKKRKRGET